MELIKHPSKEPAQRITKLTSEVKEQIADLLTFLDENNGHFKDKWKECYALHHAQVSETPYNFFVIAPTMVGKESFQFNDRVIINPEILETPAIIEKVFPKRENVRQEDGTMQIILKKEKEKVNNVLPVDEACMSYAWRSKKKMDRFYRIKVRYQVQRWWGLSTKTEWIEALRAHIFQHEYEHGLGKNIYYPN